MWDELASVDPIGAILYDAKPESRHWTVPDFMASGAREIDHLLHVIEGLRIPLRYGRALDFGSGIGRLTQALGHHFEEVVGVDISPSMVSQARASNALGDRCRYHVNGRPDLRLFPDGHFDFVHTTRTLQLMGGTLARAYLVEFTRVLAPEGVLVIQTASHPRDLRTRLKAAREHAWNQARISLRTLARRPAVPTFGIHGIPLLELVGTLERRGLSLVAIFPDRRAGSGWESYRYVCRKGDVIEDFLDPETFVTTDAAAAGENKDIARLPTL
jgi:SAM-dependent methyltransferase